jgi:hypothetical protein
VNPQKFLGIPVTNEVPMELARENFETYVYNLQNVLLLCQATYAFDLPKQGVTLTVEEITGMIFKYIKTLSDK